MVMFLSQVKIMNYEERQRGGMETWFDIDPSAIKGSMQPIGINLVDSIVFQ